MQVPAHLLNRAVEIYLREAYPAGAPEAVRERAAVVGKVGAHDNLPLDLLERDETIGSAAPGGAPGSYVIRLGQPMYPHMKLVLDAVPSGRACAGQDFLLRVDAHDRHLHAAPGSPDAAWLASVRHSNQTLVEKIEGAWAAEGLPTFKEFLRKQLEERKRAKG